MVRVTRAATAFPDPIPYARFHTNPGGSVNAFCRPRQHVVRHVDFYGSNSEISEWLKKNADRLVFDKKTKQFTISPDKKTPAQKHKTQEKGPQPDAPAEAKKTRR